MDNCGGYRACTILRISELQPCESPPKHYAAQFDITRNRPRRFLEWKTLRSWGKLPDRGACVSGFLLRVARESAGLTQAQLALRLEVTQQAVAQAERWDSNPSVAFIKRWAEACGTRLEIRFSIQ